MRGGDLAGSSPPWITRNSDGGIRSTMHGRKDGASALERTNGGAKRDPRDWKQKKLYA